MSWKVILMVILGVNDLHRFGLMPTWLVSLQIKYRVTIILVMEVSYEGTPVYF